MNKSVEYRQIITRIGDEGRVNDKINEVLRGDLLGKKIINIDIKPLPAKFGFMGMFGATSDSREFLGIVEYIETKYVN